MEYVKTGRTADDYTEIINDLVQKARENPTWKREYMDAMMDAVHQQREMREAEKKGERNARLETARRMLSRGKATTQEIAEDTGLTVEEIEQLR